MRALVAASLCAIFASSPHAVESAIGDAGAVTSVAVEAPLYDSRPAAAGGCDPAGCLGELSRDGDSTTPDSRWSCKPSLGPTGSTCSITYTLADSLDIVGLNVALHQGDTRTRTMDIYVDDIKFTSWTSSGTTIAFENIELGVAGQTVELRGVGADSEWLSITEVEILVDDGVDGTTDAVLASSLSPQTTSALLYDTSLAVDGGCDPNGCTASNTQDGEMANMSRWSCAPKLGGEGATCSISYTYERALDFSELRLALYKGDIRARTVEVYVDGVLATTWTSSGTTDGFETIDLSGTSGTMIEIVGVLGDSEWLSIIETEIMAFPDNGVTPPPSPTPTPPTTGPPTTGVKAVPASSLTPVTTSALLYDTNVAVDGGCDPNGCTASNTQDGEMADMSRWSCAPKLGGEGAKCSISYTFRMALDLSELRLALYKGDTRVTTVEVYVNGVIITTWTSSGTTNGFETIDLSGTSGTMIEIVGVLGDSEWLSIIEAEIMVFPDTGVTQPPSPTPTEPTATPSPTTGQPVTPSGDLQPVGLLPLVVTSGTNLEKSYLKDGDLSTSWSCTGDPQGADDPYYDCNIYFNLYSYRHIKQVKIALSDGAGAVDMRIAAEFNGDLGETFVTSSGTADGFETYDFDVFTKVVAIAGIFTSAGQSITILEVEILEEIQPGEVTVTSFNTPYDNGDGLWIGPTTDAFDWSSDSDEALDRTLSWSLNSFATMDAIEMQFPVGDTYKFDLELFDGGDDARQVFAGLESEDTAGWQSFDLTSYTGEYVTLISIVMKGTGSGAPGFKLLDARFMGTPIDNPSDTFYVGSTLLEDWGSQRYPDFVAEGSGDQKAIMGAICAVKKASFNGVDCEGGDDAATGTVEINFGEWFVDGNIFMKSGVFLNARYSIDDSPYTTDILVEEGAAGMTDIDAVVVMDGISDARIDDLWIRGRYNPESNDPAVSGFGSVGLSIVGSSNITCIDTDIRFCDGDGLVVRNSQNVNIDAGSYDEEYLPWTIGISRGTGILVDSSDSVWVRRHTVYDNGVAGVHVMGSNNFTFEATIAGECFGDNCVVEGEGNVGSVDGQQPIEVIVESSTLVKFQDMKVQSANDPVMTVSGSTGVSFDNCGFSNVESGTCVIKVLDTESEVATGGDPELSLQETLEGPCYVKV